MLIRFGLHRFGCSGFDAELPVVVIGIIVMMSVSMCLTTIIVNAVFFALL